jgi:hypothetical protein
MNEKNNNFYFIHLYKMKKQDKHYMIFGLLAVLLITLWSASWQIQEGFKEGAAPIDKSKAKLKQRNNRSENSSGGGGKTAIKDTAMINLGSSLNKL